MKLKQLLFTSGAALAMFGTTTLSTIVANADTAPAKTQTAANANKAQNNQGNQNNQNKSNDNKTAGQSKTTPTQNGSKQATPAANSNAQKNDSTAKTNPTNNNGSVTDASSNKNQPVKNDSAKTPAKNTPAKAANGTNKAASTNFDQRAPRLTGTTYKTYNKGLSASVTADKDNSTLNYSVKTFESDGTTSSKPAQLKIYKDGTLYKTINASSGSTDGSLQVDKGTYSLRVYTSASTHYAGGLSIN